MQTKSVLEQRWPAVDDDYKVPMLVKVSSHYWSSLWMAAVTVFGGLEDFTF